MRIHPEYRFALGALLVSFTGTIALAQTTAQTPADPAKESPLELSPFEVRSAPDKSYGALNSNSITSFSADLGKIPMSADIFTAAFMEDTNSTTLESMLRNYSAGAGIGSAAGDVGGIPINQGLDRGGGDNVSAGVTLRGLGAAVVKQDGFMLPSPAGTGINSNFGMERVEVINGPQALLYGNGGGGGVVNTISKQAYFKRPMRNILKFQIDEYGHTLGQYDFDIGYERVAVALSLLRQELGDNRDWMGGPLTGYYLQLGAKLGQTTFRLTGKQTDLNRFIQQSYTVNAGSLANDGRHGQNLRYLLATDQIMASKTGSSGAGPIASGNVNWDNVDSFSGDLRNEETTARLISLTADSVWKPWLSTQLSAGYQDKESVLGYASALSLVAPNAPTNPLPGQWAMIGGGGSRASRSNQPSDSKSFRASALLTNELFNGRAHSQTIIGADFTEGNYATMGEAYYQADASFAPILVGGQRVIMASPNPYWSVHNGPVEHPFSWAGDERITYNGVNYVRQVQNLTNPALISPSNPQGVTAIDQYINSRAISRGIFAANFTQWADGKLNTLLGMRYMSAENRQLPSTPTPAVEIADKNVSFSAGANYKLNSWLNPYFVLSDTYNLPGILLTVPADPLNAPAKISHSFGQEIGVKIGDPDGRFSGSVAAYAVQTTDDPYAILAQLRDSINPEGINGRLNGAGGTVINVERKSAGVQIALTARPTKNWRLRFSAAMIKGTIGNSTSYDALYNDQFNANAQGQVTYANGTVVYVSPTFVGTPGTSANAGYIPLTIAMLSTPSSPYYANPDPETGSFRTSGGRTVLLNVNPTHGAIRTGVAGRPMSQYQLTGVTPITEIVTSRAGDRTTGYPAMSFNLTSVYTVSSGALRGLKFGGTASVAWDTGDYYFYPNGYSPTATRELFRRPTSAQFDGILGYERKFGRFTWSTQVNVRNLLDHYKVVIRPNNITGWNGLNNAMLSAEPRSYVWTNTLSF